MTRQAYRHDAKPETPLTSAFGEIPDREQINDAQLATLDMTPLAMADPEPITTPKRSRRPKDLPTEIDRHIAMIHEAHQAVQRCKRLHEKTGVRLANATRDYAASQKELDAAQAELNRLMGITTPPETTETANPTSEE